MSDELRVDSGALIFATLADVYISSGMIDEAISILNDGLVRNPDYHLARIILGRAHYIKGNIDEAIKVIESVYDEVKDSENANLYLGHCYRDLGQKEKARTYYEATLKVDPENSEALKEIEKLIPDFTPPPKVAEVTAEYDEPVENEEIAVPVVEEAEPKPEIPTGVVEEEIREPVEEQLDHAPPMEVTIPATADEQLTETVDIGSIIEELPEKTKATESVPLEALDRPVKRLLDLDTVKSVFISSKDGLLIKNYGAVEHDVEAVCAAVAAICMDVDESFRLLKRGGLTRCIIEKPRETLCVMAVGDSLLTVVTQVEAKPGLVFIYARKIIEEIEEILG